MPRRARKKSECGIYHIMLRGINQQQIFEDEEDNAKFIQVLKDCKAVSEFQILSYCLMGNHVHLLLKIEKEPIEQVFKRICGRYVYWYNVKYQRVGHLFQDRFKSEPVEDDAYLLTVIRYIHQNPVKAGLSSSVENYKWSSYSEYFKDKTFINTSFVLSMISIGQFKKLNNEYLDITCLDIDDSKKLRMTDEQAKILIERVSGCSNIGEFQELETVKRNACLREFAQSGMSIRQASRLTGISFGIVRRFFQQ